MSACKHDGPLADEDFDLEELLAGISDGEEVFFSGNCPKCNQHVTRKYVCVSTVVTDENEGKTK